MKYIKTYGIDGLLEWHGVIESHGVKMKVDFTNGSLTAVGVAPATFTTKNELTQHIIENSDMFKSGRIHLTMSTPIPGSDEKPKTKAAPKVDPVPAPKVEVPEEDKNPKGDETDEQPVEETEQEPAEVDGDKEPEGGNKVTRLEMPSLDDAKAYLIEHFGYKSSNIRSKTAIIAAGAENGIEFVFPN